MSNSSRHHEHEESVADFVPTEHVVFVVQNLSVPEDTRVWREAQTLRRAGYRVSVISPRSKGQARRERLDGITVRRYRVLPELPGMAGQVLETLWALARTTLIILRMRLRRRIHALHAANPPDIFFLLGWLLRLGRTRFVYDQHDAVPELYIARGGDRMGMMSSILRMLERCSVRSAALIITPNNSYRAICLRRCPTIETNVITIRSGPESTSKARNACDIPAVIAFAGVMGRQDGVITLIEAVAALRGLIDTPFVVAMFGRGDQVPILQARAEALGVSELFTWHGWVDQATLKDGLVRATVTVSPDPASAFTHVSTMTKIAEYIALRLPVVAADLPETRETAGPAAALFRPGDSDALAEELGRVIVDVKWRRALVERSTVRAPRLLWSHSAHRLVAAYAALFGRAPMPPGDQIVGADS